ncbi:hypothetical protein ACM26V_02350 [Salipaludibacillus sp. HK11]|uniref:hypothetical protein n=1 Tax=Salipaludibacillus sp. HK11 TaxID=3394320 RepID=UPI0039FBEBA6
MPAISKIRFTNVIYEDGQKRYNDEIFLFDGQNGAILLENGGGKTVLIQTALQAILPHTDLANRKLKNTLKLDEGPAHIAIEWLLNDRPRQYAVTAVSLYVSNNRLESLKFTYDYGEGDPHRLENLPFSQPIENGGNRGASRYEIQDHYQYMTQQYPTRATTFQTIKDFQSYIEEQYYIIASEWESIAKINSSEGGVEDFFEQCKTTQALFDRLLIPTVERVIRNDSFVETFETYREGFKEYKQFKETIIEKEKIRTELDSFVQSYTRLHDKQLSYQSQKSWMKALLEDTQKAMVQTENEQREQEIQLQKWQESQFAFDKKKASFHIAKMTEKRGTIQADLLEKQSVSDKIYERKQEYNRLYYSLKIAEMKKNLHEANAQHETAKRNLASFEEDEKITDVSEQLDDVKQQLKRVFEEKERHLEEEKQGEVRERETLKTSLTKAKQETTELEKQRRKLEQDKGRIEGSSQSITKLIEQLSKSLFVNKDTESIENLQSEWSAESQRRDEQAIQLVEENKTIDSEERIIHADQAELKEKLTKQERESSTIQTKLDQLEQAHQRVMENLAFTRDSWSNLRSVYDKATSIQNQLDSDVTKAQREKETMLLKERNARRMSDDYQDQDLFYADPVIGSQIDQWKNQFQMLETGYRYLNQIDHPVSDATTLFPFWAMTLITTTKEHDNLKKKVQSLSKRLFPVFVLTIEEAKALLVGNLPNSDIGNVTLPTHWITNGDKETFNDWKSMIRTEAEDAERTRAESEDKLSKWTSLKQSVIEFFNSYSPEYRLDLRDRAVELTTSLKQMRKIEKYNIERLKQLNRNRLVNNEKISQNKDYMNYLQKQMKDANLYQEYLKEKATLDLEAANLAQNIRTLDRNQLSNHRQLESLTEEITYKTDAIQEWSNRLLVEVYENEIYKQVKDLHSIATNSSIANLTVQLNDLKDQERHLTRHLETVQLAFSSAEKEVSRLEHDISELRLEFDDFDEDLTFPFNGEERKRQARKETAELETRYQQEKEGLDRMQRTADKQTWTLEQALKTFKDQFAASEPLTFSDSFAVVEQTLEAESSKLTKRKFAIEEQRKRIDSDWHSLDKVFRELDGYDKKYKYSDPAVDATVLTEENNMTISYQRSSHVNDGINLLEQMNDELEQERQNIQRAKNQFKDFCRTEVSDVRLSQRAIQGVDYKNTYDEVIEFQTNMETNIRQAIKYAEAAVQKHDEAFEQFITHIHMHLKKLANELRFIPNKTRVKIEQQWKHLYTFVIPEWDDEQGHDRIRQHVDWMIDELEKDTFKDSDGNDDLAKMKQQLEVWLHSKQLLRRVINEKSLKVNCRKVGNNNDISSRSYTWEQSNNWSGGEKWSKNMTLFLGLLNYVAEKQQHIIPNITRHRSVILDNPFGKASSDHVLSPVFFIAEKLGFQIIALTAHTEGKFLQDYFPVLYSCRLRDAKGSSKQLMSKDKWIHQAYFQDHDPMALERLGEHEQTSLF